MRRGRPDADIILCHEQGTEPNQTDRKVVSHHSLFGCRSKQTESIGIS